MSTIYRDSFGVPHVYGTTRANTEFGAGWVTAEDRGLYLQLLRGPGAALGARRAGLRRVLRRALRPPVHPERQTEAFLATQAKLAQKTKQGRQLVADVDAYIRGINAYFKSKGGFVTPYTRNDVTAIGTLIGAVFGAGGGHEAQSAQFLSSLQQRLGATKGLAVWNDLREHMDPQTPVTVAQAFPYANGPTGIGSGNVTIDAGSYTPVVAGGGPLTYVQHRQLMSNALLDLRRSARRAAIRSSSQARRSATTRPRSSWKRTCTAAASMRAASRSRASASTSRSDAAPTTRGARPPRAPT